MKKLLIPAILLLVLGYAIALEASVPPVFPSPTVPRMKPILMDMSM